MPKQSKKTYVFHPEDLQRDLLAEARALRVHSGFAEIIAIKTISAVEAYLTSHPVVTKKDIDDLIYKELKKYHKDLAYIYHNRDKII